MLLVQKSNSLLLPFCVNVKNTATYNSLQHRLITLSTRSGKRNFSYRHYNGSHDGSNLVASHFIGCRTINIGSGIKNNYSCHIFSKYFSKSSAAKAASKASPSAPKVLPRARTIYWKQIARIVKTIRIPFIVVSVFSLGYQQGIIDYATNPGSKEKKILLSILADYGVKNLDTEVMVYNEGRKTPNPFVRYFNLGIAPSSSIVNGNGGTGDGGHVDGNNSQQKKNVMLMRIARTGRRIIQASLAKAEKELEETIQKIIDDTPENERTQETLKRHFNRNEEAAFWIDVYNRLDGSWQFYLIDSEIPNAFVSEVLPKRIFITTGIFEALILNDDELGLVLGHEVSHMILSHNSSQNYIELILRSIEVLLLSMDPTDGLISLSFMAALGGIRKLLANAHSRENERQADKLGIQLAAMACFDTKMGTEAFRKMNEINVSSIYESSSATIFSTHPPSKERYDYLLKTSEEENVLKYNDSTCKEIQRSFRRMFR